MLPKALVALTLALVVQWLLFSEGSGEKLFKDRHVLSFGGIQITPSSENNAINFALNSIDNSQAIVGKLGLSLPDALGQFSGFCDAAEAGADECMEWGDFGKLYMTAAKTENGNCARIQWYSPYARRIEDCFEITPGVHWYGGGGPTYKDTWPIETESRREVALVAGDSLGGYEYGGVTENFWVLSSGVTIHVDEDVPLYFSVNSTRPNHICFVGQDTYPYKVRNEIRLKYDLCVGASGENFKDVYERARNKYYAKPKGIPDERMLIQPFWSTWAEYKEDVTQELVLELANRLIAEGFSNSSHIEIDDDWETCYGEAAFNAKFPDPAAMTASLRALGFRSTLWTHPFINFECPSFQTAFDAGYFIKDEKNKFGMTQWWQGRNSGIIDYTNPAAVAWWEARLRRLQTEYGIDSFKFDAGEINWMPASFKLTGDVNNEPNVITTKYVEACAKFGSLIEVRVGRQNQVEPIFVRMLDKDSRWGYDNGLQSMIPTLLDFGLKGYPFILPDMIGGNAYQEQPSKELYVRWMQANAFMPSVQFSILPWNYDQETVNIVKGVLKYREEYADLILNYASVAVETGNAINLPMWAADPTDPNTYTIDDQYMLGDAIVVAPVLQEGAVTRNIYLPKGGWTYPSPSGPVDYTGPIRLTNFDAPLNTLPFFVRTSLYNDRHNRK